MTSHFHLRFERSGHTGANRFAESWSTPVGAFGGAVCATQEIVGGNDQRGTMRWFADRDHRAGVVTSKWSKPIMSNVSGYRPFDAGSNSAESNCRGGTP